MYLTLLNISIGLGIFKNNFALIHPPNHIVFTTFLSGLGVVQQGTLSN